jgi:hypothetical protein
VKRHEEKQNHLLARHGGGVSGLLRVSSRPSRTRIFEMKFADTLKILPEFAGDKLVLTDAAGAEVATIANAPGTAGSFRVYAYLAQQYGTIHAEAAAEGLAIFAEYTEDASTHPGKHPNIDRLIAILTTGTALGARII